MKKLLLAVALTTALTAPVHAEKASCEDIAGLAKSVMSARQNGVSLSKLIKITGKDNLMKTMVMLAYDETRFSTKKFQDRAVSKFENKWMLACLKNSEK